MLVILHIITALISVAYSTYIFIAPSKTGLRINYALIGLTTLSGTYLIVSKPAHMLETCSVGLLYVGFVTVGVVVARRKLASATISHKDQ
jgi:hypothetical protein